MSTTDDSSRATPGRLSGSHGRFVAAEGLRAPHAGFGAKTQAGAAATDGLSAAPSQPAVPLAVLLVDDRSADLQRHWRMLADQFGSGVRTHVAHTAAEGLAIMAREPIAVAVVEYQLPDADGLGLLASMATLYPHISTVMLTAHGNEQVAAKAMQLGARDYLIKDQIDAATLARSIRRATRLTESDRQQARRVEQLRQSRQDLDEVVRALSHDMTANFMLLDHSFRRLKDSTVDPGHSIARASTDPSAVDPSATSALSDLSQRFAHVEACLKESKRFLDDLVTLARTGGVQMEASRAELNGVVAEVLFEQRELLAERGINVTPVADLPPVWCNPARVKQVLTNLVRNAAKHGCSGAEPRIAIARRAAESVEIHPLVPAAIAARPLVWLAVCDNGPGIPAESREEIFMPGRRLASAHPEGSGMGLSIVKRIVEYYGGRVYLDPAADGTAIVFSLPGMVATKTATLPA